MNLGRWTQEETPPPSARLPFNHKILRLTSPGVLHAVGHGDPDVGYLRSHEVLAEVKRMLLDQSVPIGGAVRSEPTGGAVGQPGEGGQSEGLQVCAGGGGPQLGGVACVAVR